MKTLTVLLILLSGCSSIQLEGINYVLPGGQTASCIEHPEKEGFMQCSYMDGDQKVVIAIKEDLLSGGSK